VDGYLADGVTEQDVDEWVRTAAVLHSNGDGMDLAARDGRIVGLRGRADDRVNHGRLDPKDLYGWQANNASDRLTVPLVRRDGQLVSRRPEPDLVLLADLRRLHRKAAGVSLDGELLAQGAQAAKDTGLVQLTQQCHPQTLRQMKWANAMLKTLAPQILAS
jgi:hypothetical protein